MSTVINGRSNLATDPIRNFRFLVSFTPHNKNAMKGVNFSTHVGFTSVSGLSVTTESIPYREGGFNTSVHQIPGQTTFSPITLQRGVVLGTQQNWDWMKQLYRVVNGGKNDGAGPAGVAGANSKYDFRCDVQIRVLSHPMAGAAVGDQTTGQYGPSALETVASGEEADLVAMRFKVYNAWPTALAFSDLNAGDNALLVEQMTLVHEGFDMKWAKDFQSTAPNNFV